MKAIINIDKQSTKLTKQNTLRMTLAAWKEAHAFLKKEKQNIKSAERPIINLIPFLRVGL